MTSTFPRQRLPNRRPSHTEALEVAGQVFTATVGFDECAQPRELFLTAGNGQLSGGRDAPEAETKH